MVSHCGCDGVEDCGATFRPSERKSGVHPAGVAECGRDQEECEISEPVADCGTRAGERGDDERAGGVKGDEAFDVC